MKSSLISFKKKLLKTNILPVIAIGFIIFLTLWAILTIVVPLLVGDGLNNYTGLKRTVAERAFKWEDSNYRVQFERRPLQVHVDEVRPIGSDEIAVHCPKPEYVSDDPNNPAHYTVVMSISMIGSFTVDKVTIHGCVPWENDPVGGHPFRY